MRVSVSDSACICHQQFKMAVSAHRGGSEYFPIFLHNSKIVVCVRGLHVVSGKFAHGSYLQFEWAHSTFLPEPAPVQGCGQYFLLSNALYKSSDREFALPLRKR